jgi:hypothetical protein
LEPGDFFVKNGNHDRPEMEGSWALPHGEFGLDGIALIGTLRFCDHRSVPEIHQALLAQGMRISLGSLRQNNNA